MTQPAAASNETWDGYIRRFHDERAGITDAVLGGARSRGISPYEWAVEAIDSRSPVVDLACGGGPLHELVAGPLCVGVDASSAELALAARAGAGPLVRASAGDIPLARGAAAAIVCSMSLQILQPLDRTLDEVARVLAPGAVFVAVVPANGPLSVRDQLRYARLLIALRRRRLDYPNDDALTNPGRLFAAHALDVVRDERRRFGLLVGASSMGEEFVRSLYLPGTSPARLEAAGRLARRWLGDELGIPLRRIVAIRRDGPVRDALPMPVRPRAPS